MNVTFCNVQNIAKWHDWCFEWTQRRVW